METQVQSITGWRTSWGNMIARLLGGPTRPADAGESAMKLVNRKAVLEGKATGFWSDWVRNADPIDKQDKIPRFETNSRTAILVPVNFSASSFRALDCGLRLAQKAKAELILLHVVQLNLTPYGPGNPEWLKAALRREAADKAEAVADKARKSGVAAQCLIEEGAPAEVITRVAAQKEAQMIVMAAPKRGPIARLFRQKTVEQVIRNVQCPVVVLQTNLKEGFL